MIVSVPPFSFHMNTLLLASPEDHYAFLLPVMKTLLSQADQLLDDFVYQIPNMPSPQFNSKFQEEFQVSMFGSWWESVCVFVFVLSVCLSF